MDSQLILLHQVYYPNVYSLALAGGGIQGGQVYGASDRKGTEPSAGACSPADIHATAFKAMGIDPFTELHDVLDRPFQLCDGNPLPLFQLNANELPLGGLIHTIAT